MASEPQNIESFREDPDWAYKTAAKIEHGVEQVRAKTVDPLFKIGRILSFAVAASLIGSTVAVLFSVLLVRILTVYLFGGHVWISYLVLGGISSLSGLLLWSRMSRKQS